jgi:AcrR family transcriptional regulator
MDSPIRTYAVRTQREGVLEAMVHVAAAKGYESASIAEVAARAGIAEDEFGEMFDSKSACFLEAYDAVIDVLLAHVAGAFEAAFGEPWQDRVVAGLRAMVELLAAEAEIARMAIVEVAAIGEDARIRYRAALERFVPFLEEGRTVTPGGLELPEETARFAIASATSMLFSEIRAGRGAELQRTLPDLVFAVMMPYLGVEAAEAEMRRVAADAERPQVG